MKVQIIGTGSILTDHMSACAVVDDKILVDCPNGSVKAMRKQNIVPIEIDICLITHFHADHYFDIPFLLLEQGLRPIRKNDFTIIGPKFLMEQIDKLFMLAYPEDWNLIKKQSRLKIIEVNEDEIPININGYEIVPYKVRHSVCDAFGYTICDKNRTVGFTGDTILCPSVERLVQSCNMTFADMSFEKGTKTHMGMNDIEYLIEKYGKYKKIIPTHMSDGVRAIFSDRFSRVPNEGDVYNI